MSVTGTLSKVKRLKKLKAERRARRSLNNSNEVPFSRYAVNPEGFIREVLGIEVLTREQIDILESVRDHRETNVQACHGSGKSFISALIVFWWVFAVGGVAITTAPTESQVKDILWKEIRTFYDLRKSVLGGDRGVLYLKYSETAQAWGFTSRNYDSNSFQGKHAEKLLLIQDEACGITQEIDDGFAACLTGSKNRGLRIGNPISANTPFAKACKHTCIKISAWSHPNVSWAYEEEVVGEGKEQRAVYRLKPEVKIAITDPNPDNPKDPILPQEQWPEWCPKDVIPGAISIQWIEQMRLKKGERSAYFQSRVDGEFVEDVAESIIPRSWFKAARARYDANPAQWDFEASKHQSRWGLDVGDGGDPHALARWQGPVLYEVEEKPTLGDREDVARASRWGWDALMKHPGTIMVDRIGVGSGALAEILGWVKEGRLMDVEGRIKRVRLPKGCSALPCSFGSRPDEDPDDADDETNVRDIKTQLFWSFRLACESGEIAIAPLGAEMEDKVMEGFSSIYYDELRSGVTFIEDKKRTRERLGRSPDPEEAIVMGYGAQPKRTAAASIMGGAV